MLLRALLAVSVITAALPSDTKFCGVPTRDKDGSISRSTTVLAEFKKEYPCPATQKPSGPCPGWNMDHVVPLACGGCDAPGNLQWLPTDMWKAKSLWERKVYGGHQMSKGCP